MADANLLKELNIGTNADSGRSRYSNKKLYNIAIYGNVRALIKKPSYFNCGDLTEKMYYAILDVFAVKCLEDNGYFKEEGYVSIGAPLFSRGSMIITLDDKTLVGKNVIVQSTARKGATIGLEYEEAQSGVEAIKGFDKSGWTLNCVPFRKDSEGNWVMGVNYVHPLEQGNRENLGTDLEYRLFNGVMTPDETGKVEFDFPESTLTIAEYVGTRYPQYLDLGAEEVNGLSSEPLIRTESGRVDLTQIKMDLTKHLDVQEESPLAEAFSGASKGIQKALHSSSMGLSKFRDMDNEELSEINELFRKMCEEIASSWNIKLQNGRTGKELGMSLYDNAKELFQYITEQEKKRDVTFSNFLPDEDEVKMSQGVALREIDCVVGGWLLVLILGTICGVSVKELASSVYNAERRTKSSVSHLLALMWCKPFIVGHIIKLPFSVLAFLYSMNGSSEREEGVDTLIGYNIIESLTKENSFLLKKTVMTNWYETLAKVTKIDKQAGNLCELLLDRNLGFQKEVYYSDELMETLDGMGLILMLELEDGSERVLLGKDVVKQVHIYNTLRRLGQESTGIDEEMIARGIEAYQEKVGFKLEALQAESIQLCKFRASVLSGCAGSGKTTTSECMKMVFEENLEGYEYCYGAPTGKACRRLSEVVGGGVKTLHSMFSVMVGEEPPLKTIYLKDEIDFENREPRVYILDEMAMCNIDLLFEVCANVGGKDIIIFLGDVKQLPPIGNGFPFYSLMKLLPCVELGVSKRAAEGSLVNYNCSVINFLSNGYDEPLIYDDNSFRGVPCPDTELVRKTVSEFDYWLSKGIAEDDIQIISGYVSEEKMSSTRKINPIVQKKLRANDRALVTQYKRYGDAVTFHMNDRVIHINVNQYGKRRFNWDGKNSFQEVITLGMVNGDMGKVVGLVPCSSVRCSWFNEANENTAGGLSAEEVKTLISKRDEYADKLETYNFGVEASDNEYVMVVENYDVDLDKNVYVLYYCKFLEGRGTVAMGPDLRNLDLSYALTCHKMQGSQAQAVIIPLEKKSNPSFINRNMINTMITRSQGKVSLVGSIGNEYSSALSRGRGEVALKIKSGQYNDLLEKLVESK